MNICYEFFVVYFILECNNTKYIDRTIFVYDKRRIDFISISLQVLLQAQSFWNCAKQEAGVQVWQSGL